MKSWLLPISARSSVEILRVSADNAVSVSESTNTARVLSRGFCIICQFCSKDPTLVENPGAIHGPISSYFEPHEI